MEALDNDAPKQITPFEIGPYKAHFDAYEPQYQAADYALMDALVEKASQ
jgi:hypothetical protein